MVAMDRKSLRTPTYCKVNALEIKSQHVYRCITLANILWNVCKNIAWYEHSDSRLYLCLSFGR